MPEETAVTRGSQITLTRDIRRKLHIREGDRLVLNVQGGVLLVSKRDPRVFDEFESFLPTQFGRVLKALRADHKKRLRRMGIVQ